MNQELQVVDLGRVPYAECLETQERLVRRRKAGEAPDTLLLVEHDPVYTLGRNADSAHVLATDAQRRARGVDVVETSRGGDVTYHGPGQLVGYPIIDLASRRTGVLWYVESLEDVLLRVLADFGITGCRRSENRGVWVGESKVAAIGVRITRGVTMHGFALNVTTDLSYYDGIVPCGLADRGVQSMQGLNPAVDAAEVRRAVVRRFAEVFAYETVREADA